MRKLFFLLLLVCVMVAVFPSCSLNKMITRAVVSSLGTGGADPFSTEEDPQLVAEALPFALKLYETLLQSDPDNRELLLTLAQGYVSYAKAFVEEPARRLPLSSYAAQKKAYRRARLLYLRGARYALHALEEAHPRAFAEWEGGDLSTFLGTVREEDVAALYWGAAGLLSAISLDPSDPELSLSIPKAVSLAATILLSFPDSQEGAVHEMFISLYGGLPEALWWGPNPPELLVEGLRRYYESEGLADATPEGKARHHFERAVALSGGKKLSPYITYAESIVYPRQDKDTYRNLLERALSIPPGDTPEHALENAVAREKAEWLLETLDDRFF
ncbi:hypothetical protein Spith_2082 [Spirochaeta thermophila DSM 6578]|uniref:Uncharacterized protein n=1 Tax=Winmispira thermophila (strain ATCC 700085 / DSM 6578 / Z-1203) TaxID=869211 RepID=G0GEZ4_WINT7|nr:TRAP transporter TatT component family protein [Spirochaeta thermophila]AEJ62338.1 hypothetical protein Spith_2082 [Spirochaeta thermophila DSM 6578]